MSDSKKTKKLVKSNGKDDLESDKNSDLKANEKLEKKIQEEKNKIKNEEETITRSIRRLGNFLLTIIVTLIVGTGALLYYLVNVNPQAQQEIENAITATPNEENKIDLGNIIDSAVASTNESATDNTVSASTASTRKTQNENIIVLYNGLVLDTRKMDLTELKYIDSSSKTKDKYVITYYNYEDFQFVKQALGTLSEQVYDGLIKIKNVSKVAISENYNAIPRTIKVVNSIPTIVADNNPKLNGYDLTKVIIVDLDGNGTEEYILALANTVTGYSKITLVDSQGEKVADLAYIEKSKWETVSKEEYRLTIDHVEILDIDNDGVMEILVEIPKYEGEPGISILRYKNGELSGKQNIECSLLP